VLRKKKEGKRGKNRDLDQAACFNTGRGNAAVMSPKSLGGKKKKKKKKKKKERGSLRFTINRKKQREKGNEMQLSKRPRPAKEGGKKKKKKKGGGGEEAAECSHASSPK